MKVPRNLRSIAFWCITLLSLHFVNKFLQALLRLIRINTYPAEATWLPCIEQSHLLNCCLVLVVLDYLPFPDYRKAWEHLFLSVS